MHSRSFRTLEVCLVALAILISCRQAAADEIALRWDASSGQVAGYKVYVGTQSGSYSSMFDVGAATTYRFPSAVTGRLYCFVVVAYTRSAQSGRSNEVCGFSNAPPTLTNPGDRTSMVGQATSLPLVGLDPEGRPLIFSATGLPPGLSLMANTGLIGGTATTVGTYRVTVNASDGVLASSQTFVWTISAPPTPPPSASVRLSTQAFNRTSNDRVLLTWTTSSWTQVWVYRNNVLIAQTANDGSHTDYISRARGDYTYTVCAPNRTACSNVATARF